MSTTPSFDEQVRAVRRNLGISQEQLASILNVSFATVNRWEAGNAKPQRTQLEAFNKLLDGATLFEEADGVRAAAVGRHRHRRGMGRSAVLSNKSMEQMLWDAAC